MESLDPYRAGRCAFKGYSPPTRIPSSSTLRCAVRNFRGSSTCARFHTPSFMNPRGSSSEAQGRAMKINEGRRSCIERHPEDLQINCGSRVSSAAAQQVPGARRRTRTSTRAAQALHLLRLTLFVRISASLNGCTARKENVLIP